MRSRPPGLLGRLALAAILAGTAAGAVGVTIQTATARDALRHEVISRSSALAVELAARVDSQIENERSALATAATRASIADLGPGAAAELRVVVASSNVYDDLVLYDGAGTPLAVASDRAATTPADERPRPDLITALRSGPHAAVLAGFPVTLEIAVPVQSPPGTIAGVLLARVPFEDVATPVLRVDPDTGTVRYLIGGDGRIIAHPERDRVLRRERSPVADRRLLRAGGGRTTIDGTKHLVGVAPLRLLDASVVTDQAETVALAPIGDRLRQLSLVLAATVAAIVAAVIGVGAWLLSPLQPLAHAVRRLGHRERGVRVDEHGRAEAGALAAEFNRLAAVLDDRQEAIDELQRLSLLVNTRTSADEVAAALVDGAGRLVHVDSVAFCATEGDTATILAAEGDRHDGAALQQAVTAKRVRQLHQGLAEGVHYAAVPAYGADRRILGALVLGRASGPLDAEELELVQTYTSFASVAFENVGRLVLEQGLAAELADAVEQRRSLLSTVSHEFRTPLTCIDGFSSMLLSDWDTYDDDDRRELVGKIRQHGRELDDLVSRLLDFAVTERGQLQAAVGPVVLHALVAEVVDVMRPVHVGRAISVEVSDLMVQADPVLVRRALSNLLSNAVKYSPTGSPITIRAVDDGRRARIEVIDRGSGLSAEDAARAFQPFWRAGNLATRTARGSGLGLSLVAEYAKAMGGAAGVVSEPGHGSTFFLLLPLAPAAD